MNQNNTIAHPIHALIESRKSIRAFSATPVSAEQLQQLFEAARWSFSASNEQGWRFVYGMKGSPEWRAILDSLMEGNKTWAQHAPLLIASLVTRQTARNTHYKYGFHDVGAATMLMAIQAVDMGMQIHPMGGFVAEKLQTTLSIPDTLEPVTVIAVGYPSNDLSELNEKQQIAEVTRGLRMPQEEFIL